MPATENYPPPLLHFGGVAAASSLGADVSNIDASFQEIFGGIDSKSRVIQEVI